MTIARAALAATIPALHPEPAKGLHLVGHASPIAAEVFSGLTAHPKTLSPWLFYDAAGSDLFEKITDLPEYYLTRAERSIFTAHADEIIQLARRDSQLPVHILELGAGSAAKTGLLLSAAARAQGRVLYQPIDVSASALAEAELHLQADLPGVDIDFQPHVGDYTRGYQHLVHPPGPRLALFIGSSIGNFEPAAAIELLRQLRSQLALEASFLIGVDLRKDPATLLAAYNDAAGVTAAFNKNVLVRINRELGADFDLDAFRFRATWNEEAGAIQSFLVSERAQTVRIDGAGLTIDFASGEAIHTESSHKFTREEMARFAQGCGFRELASYTDSGNRYALSVFTVL
jgi:dimethylhistidine N-methyltransferase